MNEARCSFCGKPASAVQALIKAPKAVPAGHDEVYICAKCVRVSAAILDSDDGEKLSGITKETVQ